MRLFATTDAGSSMIRTERACGPRRPSATPNSSFVPGLIVGTPVGSAEAAR